MTAVVPSSPVRVPPAVVLSFAVIALVMAWSLAPGLFTRYDPINDVPAHKLLGPCAAH